MGENLKVPLKLQADINNTAYVECESNSSPQPNAAMGTTLSSTITESIALQSAHKTDQENDLGVINFNANPISSNDNGENAAVIRETSETLVKDEVRPSQPSTSNNQNINECKDFNKGESNSKTMASSHLLKEKASSKPAKRRKIKNKLELTNKEAKNLAVIVKRSDGVKVTKELASIISQKVCDNILSAGRRNRGSGNQFQFLKSGIVDAGYFLVTAANVESRNWLMSCDLGSYEGAILRKYRRGKGKKKRNKRVPKSFNKDKELNNKDTEESTVVNIGVEELLLKPTDNKKVLNKENSIDNDIRDEKLLQPVQLQTVARDSIIKIFKLNNYVK